VVFKENTVGDSFYIILSGKVLGYKEIEYKEKQLFFLEEG